MRSERIGRTATKKRKRKMDHRPGRLEVIKVLGKCLEPGEYAESGLSRWSYQ